MTTAFKIVAAPGDYSHRKRLSTQLADMSRVGLVAEFDFSTFSTSTQMTDLSGNGHHAIWSAAPTTSANGVTFDSKYADVDLSVAYPSGLGKNRAFLFICRNISTTGYVCGDYNTTDQIGCSPRSGGAAVGAQVITGPLSSGYAYTLAADGIGSSSWRGLIVRSINGLIRANNIVKKRWEYVIGARHEPASTRTLFRIGAACQTSGADHNVVLGQSTAGEIAWCAVWDRVPTFNEERAYLQNTILPAMNTRGITLS